MRGEIDVGKYFLEANDGDICFILCRGPESFLSHLPELGAVYASAKTAKCLVLDQILVTGDSSQRFVEIPLNRGDKFLDNLKVIPGTDTLRSISSRVCRDNWSSVMCSILTNDQRDRVSSGKPL